MRFNPRDPGMLLMANSFKNKLSPFSKPPTSWGWKSLLQTDSDFLKIWKVTRKKKYKSKAVRFKLSFLFPSHLVHVIFTLWQPPTSKVTRLIPISSSNQHLSLCEELQAVCICILFQTDLFWYTSSIVFSKSSQQPLASTAAAPLVWQDPYFRIKIKAKIQERENWSNQN